MRIDTTHKITMSIIQILLQPLQKKLLAFADSRKQKMTDMQLKAFQSIIARPDIVGFVERGSTLYPITPEYKPTKDDKVYSKQDFILAIRKMSKDIPPKK